MHCELRKQGTRPMRHLYVRWAVIAVAVLLLEMNDMSNHAVSFESTRIGWTSPLTGSGDPKWTVEIDRTAPSKLTVLKQSGRATYPLILKNDTNIKNGFVEMKFKAIAGSQDRAAGIVWRATDANNYYVVRANALEDNVVLYKTVNGVRSSLDIVGRKGGYGIDVPVPANTWHSLRIDFKPPASACRSTTSNCLRSRIHVHRCRNGGPMDQGRQRHAV
jgi:hypothetical protein